MENLTLFGALSIDAFAIAVFIAIVFREARSALHPAWMFLALHVYIVSLRLLQLYMGSSPMAHTFVWPVAVNEVIRAGVASDMGLVSIGVGAIIGRAIYKRSSRARFRTRLSDAPVSRSRIMVAAWLAMGIGIFGILTVGRLEHGLKNTSWDTSGYVSATTSWPSWAMCLLIFVYGFRVPLLVLTAATLACVGIFSTGRFAVVIPIIFLTLMWLSRRRSRRIPLTLIAGIAVAWLLWLPMKPLTKLLHDGASFGDALADSVSYTYTQFEKDEGSIDSQFLDMCGATMTLADIHGSWYWGTTIVPLFYSPIPRLMWREKPRINEYQFELQVPSRNMADIGMTSGLVAEAYTNLGWAGVVLYCLAVGIVYALAYWRVAPSNYLSAGWLMYLFCLASLEQVYRDGLISAVWFTFVYAAPMGWTAVTHWIWKPGRLRRETSRLKIAPGVGYAR